MKNLINLYRLAVALLIVALLLVVVQSGPALYNARQRADRAEWDAARDRAWAKSSERMWAASESQARENLIRASVAEMHLRAIREGLEPVNKNATKTATGNTKAKP